MKDDIEDLLDLIDMDLRDYEEGKRYGFYFMVFVECWYQQPGLIHSVSTKRPGTSSCAVRRAWREDSFTEM